MRSASALSSRRVIGFGVGSLLAVGLGSAYLHGRVRAAGAPAAQPLTYAGVLTNTAGAPLTDASKNLQVTLWDMAIGGTAVCSVGPNATPLTAGAFQVVLPPACTTAIHAGGDLWIEAFVDGGSVGRSKLGATPYAIEADHAVNADQAQAGFQVPGVLTAGSATVTGGVSVGGPLIRKIARVHGDGPTDGTETGPLASRVLTFTKTRADTGIRVSYVDDLRVNASGACRWEIKFNGASCTMPGVLGYDIYYGGVPNMNHHRGESVFGTCFGLAAGPTTIQIYVGPVPTGSGQPQGDCDTGWYNQYWAIEAEEVL